MKKMLMVATVPSMIGQFNMNNIQILLELGYEVHVACDFNDRSVWTGERVEKFKDQLEEKNVKYFQVDFSRSPLKVWKHRKSYVQLKKLLEKNEYEFTHCHTPIASVICRLVAHKMKVKCIYTAHGFHFFKGAPLMNWVIYYPIEKILAKYTNILLTITKADFELARKHFKTGQIKYVPGVGVDLTKFSNSLTSEEKIQKRIDLGIQENDIMLLSVGEINKNKNHQLVIKTLAKMEQKNLHYFIAGVGELKDELVRLSRDLNIECQVHLLGYRNDICELQAISDIYIHPSFREGLSVAIMEAMACGTPVICSNIRGNEDLVLDKKMLFDAKSEIELKRSILQYLEREQDSNTEVTVNEKKLDHIMLFDLNNVNKIMKRIYESV